MINKSGAEIRESLDALILKAWDKCRPKKKKHISADSENVHITIPRKMFEEYDSFELHMNPRKPEFEIKVADIPDWHESKSGKLAEPFDDIPDYEYGKSGELVESQPQGEIEEEETIGEIDESIAEDLENIEPYLTEIIRLTNKLNRLPHEFDAESSMNVMAAILTNSCSSIESRATDSLLELLLLTEKHSIDLAGTFAKLLRETAKIRHAQK